MLSFCPRLCVPRRCSGFRIAAQLDRWVDSMQLRRFDQPGAMLILRAEAQLQAGFKVALSAKRKIACSIAVSVEFAAVDNPHVAHA